MRARLGKVEEHSGKFRGRLGQNEENPGIIWEDQGRLTNIWEDQGRLTNIWEDQGRLTNIWEDQGRLTNIWVDQGRLTNIWEILRKTGEHSGKISMLCGPAAGSPPQ
jgi:hypothetical protein